MPVAKTRWARYESGMKAVRVLVIDDDADVRALVKELLTRAGLTVEEAPDGRAGLRALHGSPPDLVVLDVSMPDLDGWQTLERIRDLTDVPVLMLTARGEELERVRGLQAGADDYVTKPFGRQELVARVQARRRPDGGDQVRGLDRLADVVRRAHLVGARDVRFLCERAEEDDWDVCRRGVHAKLLQDLDPVDVRHRDVEDRDPRGTFTRKLEC